MSSKEFYYVPVYMMIAEDLGYGDIEYELLDKIIVSKTKNGYEELDGFNNFVILKSKKDENRTLNIINYDECLYLNEDDIKEENKVEYYTFNEEEKLRCYRNLNEGLKMKYYKKDNFENFIKMKRRTIKTKKYYTGK